MKSKPKYTKLAKFSGIYYFKEKPTKAELAYYLAEAFQKIDELNKRYDRLLARTVLLSIIHREDLAKMGVSLDNWLKKIGLAINEIMPREEEDEEW